jgi:anti-sigma factor RsiW
MNHLTWNELFELIDEQGGSARRVELERHLAECPRCRRLLETQRSFERTARTIVPTQPSGDFTRRVMGMLQVSRKERRLFRLMTILGAGIPLALVGVLIGYAVSLGGNAEAQGGEDLLGGVFGDWGATVEYLQSALGSVLGNTGTAVTQAGQTDVLAVAVITIASLLLLFVADRVLLRRILRSRL